MDIYKGYGDNMFKPTNVVNRDILALVMYRMAGSPAHQPSIEAKEAFSDINTSTPNANAIYWARDAGITKGYSDGTYRPQSAASRQAAVTFLYRLKGLPNYPEEQIYSDVTPDNQFYAPIQWMGSLSVKPNFNPTSNLTRQALAVFAYRTSGSPNLPENTTCGEGQSGPFPDVPGDHAFCKEIEWAKSKNILRAADNAGNVEPTMYATRSNLALALYTLAGYPNFNVDNSDPYTDVPTQTSREANENIYIYWAKANGYLTGYSDNTFRPTNPATRQAGAEAFYRLKGKPANYPANQIYADVTPEDVFYPAIQWMGSLKAQPTNSPQFRELVFFDEDNGNKQGVKNNTQ